MSLFDKYRNPVEVEEGYWGNFLGSQTCCSVLDYGIHFSGQTIETDPIPNDGLHGNVTEYCALLEAIDRSLELGRTTFTMIELGAGWGPWVGNAGVVAKRLGFEAINLVGVEAGQDRFEKMEAHFALNDLLKHPKVNSRLYYGAIWSEKTKLHFPKVPLHDYGAAASLTQNEYRGKAVEMVEVPAWTLEDIAGDLGIIDMIHWDVQGAEAEIAESARHFINKRVRSMHIGTHSRPIEGRLFTLLDEMGWEILRETPSVMAFNRDALSLENMNAYDGEIYARNPALWHRP